MSDPDEVKKYREILTEKTKRLLNDMEHRHLYTREIIKKWK